MIRRNVKMEYLVEKNYEEVMRKLWRKVRKKLVEKN